ncbi:MAG TPA: hypothetical protein VKB96_16645, partial [Gammaproteobacteria bacterium]|nr:hypothetical protein [Gammaproteobacteria bacterium]
MFFLRTLGLLLGLMWCTAAGAQPGNDVCLGCHGNESFSLPRADGQVRSLYVVKDRFEHSIHGRFLQCVTCHRDSSEIPHRKVSKSRTEWRQSIPGMCGPCHSN